MSVDEQTAASDLLFRPATELAEAVRSGSVTSRQLVDAALGRIEALDDDINAFTTVDADGARAAADAIEPGDQRPFAGVPLAIKDLFSPVAGLPQSQGSDLFEGYVPDYDNHVVRRFKEAGFVIVGLTSCPEFGIVPTTESRRFGPTHNPWEHGRTPGGSSGGSAAAVAAGMVPIAHASDGGGSIRIPAACCGLVGLKPARGRISHGPELGDSFLTTDGVVSHTVADTAAALDVLAGYETGDATWLDQPADPFAAAVGREPGRLRIGLSLAPPIDAPLDAIAAAGARDAAELCASLGHEIDEIQPPEVPDLMGVFTALWCGLVGMGVALGGLALGREATPDNVEPLTWELYQRGRALDSVSYLMALTQLQAVSRAIIGMFDTYDVLLTPALAERPVPHGTIDAAGPDPMGAFTRSGAFTPYTPIWNVTGQPAISLPLYHGDDGLPTGVQFVGRPAAEATLLSLGAQLEAANPWADRRPPV